MPCRPLVGALPTGRAVVVTGAVVTGATRATRDARSACAGAWAESSDGRGPEDFCVVSVCRAARSFVGPGAMGTDDRAGGPDVAAATGANAATPELEAASLGSPHAMSARLHAATARRAVTESTEVCRQVIEEGGRESANCLQHAISPGDARISSLCERARGGSDRACSSRDDQTRPVNPSSHDPWVR